MDSDTNHTDDSTDVTAAVAVLLMLGLAVAMPVGVGGAVATTLASSATACEVTTADIAAEERYATLAAEKLQAWMEDDGFEEPEVAVHRGRLEMSYISTARSGDEVLAEENVTNFVVQYSCLVEAGYTMGGIYAQPYTPNGENIGAYQVQKEWAEEYNRGGLTQNELADYIADSFDSVENVGEAATTTTTPESNGNADAELATGSSDPDAVMRAIGEELESEGFTVLESEVDEYGPVMSYETTAYTADGLRTEIGIVASYYAEGVALSSDLLGVPVWVYDPSGEMVGSYEIDRDWAEAYNAGTISREEYINHVVETWVYA